ncbi:MAG: DUF1566 domain-containing protein [Polaromonas sp.]
MRAAEIRGLGLALSLLVLQGAVWAQTRYSPSADGQEITDSKTGLIWRRCAEGMTWKVRTCIGQALFLNQSEAAARAKTASAPDAEWRLPVLKELSSIVSVREAEEGKAAIDPSVFPATPVARFWTSSSSGPGYFTFVGFSDGSAGESPRAAPGAVRLVRNPK